MRAVVILAVQQTISDLSFSLSVALPVSTSFVVERETESERERKRDSVQTNEGRLGRRFRCGRRCRKQICHNNYGATPLIGSTMRCVWFFLSPSFPICLSVRLSACLCACVPVCLCVCASVRLARLLARSLARSVAERVQAPLDVRLVSSLTLSRAHITLNLQICPSN